MEMRYTVEQDGVGWGVYERGELLTTSSSRGAALEVARVMTAATKAAGGGAKRLVEVGASRLEPDMDGASAP